MATKVILKDVRIAFPQLFTPKAVNGEGEPRFSAAFIIAPNSDNAKALLAATHAEATAAWKDKAKAILPDLISKGKVAYSQAPKVSRSGEVFDGFEGMHSLNSSSKSKPTVVDRDRSELTPASGKPYAGCYVNAVVEIWAQHNTYGNRINCTLMGVQFVRDGDAFVGGRPASVEEFDDLSVELTEMV